MSEVNPYRPPGASFEAPRQPRQTAALATRGSRLAARFVDNFLYALPVIPGLVLVDPEAGAAEATPASPGATALLMVGLLLAVVIFIVNLYLLGRDGQTLGKKALKVRIVRTSGELASLGRIFGLRMVAPGVFGAVPILGPFFSLTNALFIFRGDRRCIHDLLADTRVVQADARVPSAGSRASASAPGVTPWENERVERELRGGT